MSSGGNRTSDFRNVEHASCLRSSLSSGEGVSARLRLAAVPQDDLGEVDAAAVVAIGRRCPHAPQRRRQELLLHRAVVVALVEVRPEVVPLEIREDVVARRTGRSSGLLQRPGARCRRRRRRSSGRRRGEETVEDRRARGSYAVSTSATRRSCSIVEVRDVAPSASDLVEQCARPRFAGLRLLVGRPA